MHLYTTIFVVTLRLINSANMLPVSDKGNEDISNRAIFGSIYRSDHENIKERRLEDDEPLQYGNEAHRDLNTYLNPRDKYYKFHYRPSGSTVEKIGFGENNTLPWFDLVNQQLRNIMKPPEVSRTNRRKNYKSNTAPKFSSNPGGQFKEPKFHYNSFNTEGDKISIENITTCNEFAKGAIFDPNEILDLEWIPFYSWRPPTDETALPYYALIYKFTKPKLSRLNEYKRKFSKHLMGKVDWGAYKLQLNCDIEMILFAKDKRGLFTSVAYMDLPESAGANEIEVPVMDVRIKIVEPYIAIMYCEYQFAIILSVLGKEPTTDERKTAEAAILDLRGIGQPMHRDLEREKQIAKAVEEDRKEHYEQQFLHLNDRSYALDEIV